MSVIELSPRQMILFPDVIFPEGDEALPALPPRHVLLSPVSNPYPALTPIRVFVCPSVRAYPATPPQNVLLYPVVTEYPA